MNSEQTFVIIYRTESSQKVLNITVKDIVIGKRLGNSPRKREFETLPISFSKSLIFQLKIQTNTSLALY